MRSADVLADWLRGLLPPGAALVADSRRVRPGDAFFAYPGAQTDGRQFVRDALARGAAACLVESGTPQPPGAPAWREVADLKACSGPIAAAFYGHPSAQLAVVAVTGTNGKTTCTHWLAQGWQTQGEPSAVVGTLGVGVLGQLQEAGLTTPDALSLQAYWAVLRVAGVQKVAMEASSIGLHQQRLAGTQVRAAVLTNFTRDHLDYHGSMAHYLQAKAQLFAWPDLEVAVVNLDDPAHEAMVAACRPGVRRVGYGWGAVRAAGLDSVLCALDCVATANGTDLVVDYAGQRATVHTPLLGRFNAANLLAVGATWLALGMDWTQVVAQWGLLRPVSGRMQALGSQAGQPLVVVDYAHTPDALQQVLAALRPVAQTRGGRLWVVLGAGGDRDPGKRPAMGAAAAAGADAVVVTSDNPRSEDPAAIAAAVASGVPAGPSWIELDRAQAIAQVVAQAGAADVVLVAGKGHETYQEIKGMRHPFDDVGHVTQALAARVVTDSAPAVSDPSGSPQDVA